MLFAALEVATGRITNRCASRHRHQEFLAFLKQVAGAYPRRQLHVIWAWRTSRHGMRSAP